MRSCWISIALLSAGWIAACTDAQGPESSKPTVGLRELSPKAYALEHVEIVVRPGQRISNGTVLIRDGSIVAVGTEIEVPPGTERIDHSGHTVYAGLIDAFSEVDVPEPSRDTGAPNWNGNVMPQRSAARVAGAGATNSEKLRSQGITLRLIAPAGGIVKGTSCLVLCGDGDSRQLLVQGSVWQHLSLTVPRRRGGGGDSYPSSPMGAVALLRQSILDARWYTEANAGYLANRSLPRPDTDTALEALADAIGSSTFVVDAPNERMAQRADKVAKELNLSIILRGSGREYRRLDEIASAGHAMLIPVDFPDAPKIDSALDARETALVELLNWRLAPSNPARLAEAGATFCLTTDGLDDSAEYLKQVRRAVEAGLDADRALAALTVNPAKLLGVDDWVGTVEPRRLANLVVTDGDLFAEKTDTLETWVAGTRYEIAERKNQNLEKIEGRWRIGIRSGNKASTDSLDLELKRKESSLSGKLSRAEVPSNRAKAEEQDDAEGSTERDAERDDPQEEEAEEEDAEEKDAEEKDAEEEDAEEEDRSAELEQLVRERDRLSASVDLSKVDGNLPAGVSWLSFVTVTGDDGELVVEGTVRLPSGEVLPMFVERLHSSGSPQDEATKEEGAKEDGVKADERDKESDGDSSDSEADDADDGGSAADVTPIDVVYPLGAFGFSEPPAERPVVMFRGATVWTCGSEGIIKEGDVVVRNGRIEAVGKSLQVPEDCEVIDVTGKHLTPGLIDCHSHMATDGGVNETGQAVTAEVRVGDFINNSDISIYRQIAGGVTSANILHGSANPIGGQNQVIKLRWGASMDKVLFDGAPKGIKFALGENVKRSRGRYPDTRMGVEQIIRDQFLAAKEYREAHRRYQEGDRDMLPPRIDLQLEALAEVLEGKRWVHCHSYRQDEIIAMLDVLDEFGVQIGSLQHILEGYKVADRMRQHGAMASSFSDWWAYKFEVFDAIPHNAALMHRAGIIVSFNSDDAELARHLNSEAAKAVKYGGVSAEEAIKFVTLNPAKQLRIDDRVGSIEAGKDADLAVWSRSPLSTMTRCEQTWIDGLCYFSLEKDAELRERDAKLHAELVQQILDDDKEPSGARKPRIEEEDRWHRHDIFCGHDGHDHDHLESDTSERMAEEVLR